MKTNTKVITKEDLVTQTLHLLNHGRTNFAKVQRQEVEQILKAYECTVIDCLREADTDFDVEIKPFTGMKITATFKPARTISMYGEQRQVKSKISVSAKLSKYFGWSAVNQN